MATSLSQAYASHKVNQAVGDIENAMEGVADKFEDENNDDEKTEEKKSSGLKALKHSFVWTASVGTLIINILVMINASTTTIVAGVVASIVCLTVSVSEMKLEDMDTLRDVHNALRQDVNVFSGENQKLGTSIDELNVQNFMLKETEQRLKDITGEQEMNVKELVSIVDENEEILAAKRKIILQDIISDLMQVVMKVDQTEDNTLTQKEINRLMLYMKGLPAVQVNEELLKEQVNKDNSVLALMKLIHDIGDPGIQEGDKIFVIDTENDELQAKFQK